MQVIIEADYAAVCEEAARIVLGEAGRKPDLVLGLAAGKTPLGVYERLRKAKEAFAKARFFNLDEFYGLGPSNRASFHHILHEEFLNHVIHDPKNVHFLKGNVADLEGEGRDYERRIQAVGGIDLQILGLGRNGHLGFNEPGSSLGSRTRPKTLEPETLAEYLKTLDSEAPMTNFTITMGIGTLMEARHILLLASGKEKAETVKKMVEGPIAAELPASVLQLHPHVSAVLDEEAAADLKRRDYYKWVYENKWRVGQKK